MALPFGLCILSWVCICLLAQKGSIIVHGYPLGDEFSSYVGVLAPSSNTGRDPVAPRDQMQVMRPQSFLSLQREPVPHAHREEISGAVSSPIELRLVQSKPSPGYEPNKLIAMPYDILMEGYGQNEDAKGISFPTIKDLKHFVNSMKHLFLKPGSDATEHFETARDIMENEMLSNAQRNGEESHGEESHTEQNEVWNEPMNTVSEQGANYQIPDENLHVSDPAINPSLGSTSDYDSPHSGPGLVFYHSPNSAVVESVSSHYGSLSNENHDDLTSILDVQGDDQSMSNRLPDQSPMPSSSHSSDHVTAPRVILLNSPSEDVGHHSSKTSNLNFNVASEQKIQQPEYVIYRVSDNDFISRPGKTSGGFDNHGKQVLRGQELNTVPQDDVFSTHKLSLLRSPEHIKPFSYGQRFYVITPRGNLFIPGLLPKHEKPAQSTQTYQAPVYKDSKDINHSFTVQLPDYSGFDSSSSLSPRSGGHVSVQTDSPPDPQGEKSTITQPVGSYLGLVLPVKPISPYGPSGHDGYLSDHRVDVPHPSIPTAQMQNQVPIIQEQMTNEPHAQIPGSSGLGFPQSGISSQNSDGYVSFNSPADLAPSSEQTAFTSLVANEGSVQQEQNDADTGSFSLHPTSGGNNGVFRNFGSEDVISSRLPMTSQLGDILGVTNLLGSFSNQNGQGSSQNSVGFVSTTIVDPVELFNPPTMDKSQVSTQKHQTNKDSSNMRYRPTTQRQESSVSPPPLPSYIKKYRNGYVRGKMLFSKTRYTPSQLSSGKAAKDQRKAAPGQHESKNITSNNV